MAAILQLRVELAVQLADPLARFSVLDELGDEPVRSFSDLVVDPIPRGPLAHLLKGLLPSLDVQVVRVHERPVYVQKYRPYQNILLSQVLRSLDQATVFSVRLVGRPYGSGEPPVTPKVSPLT